LEQPAGYPRAWTRADIRLNEALRSAFRLGGLVGPWWLAINGYRQGAPSSMRRLSLLMAVWTYRQIYILPRALINGFFDDCSIIADTAAEIQQAMDEPDKFDTLTGQRIGLNKSVVFHEPRGDNPAE